MALPLKTDHQSLTTSIDTLIADNQTRDISPADVREVMKTTVDSAWQTWVTGTAYLAGDVIWHPTELKLIKRIADGTSTGSFEPTDWEDFTGSSFPASYNYDKRSGVTVTEVYQTIGNVNLPSMPAGIYEIKFSVAYNFADTNDSAYFQFNINGGTFYEFIEEPSDATDRLTFVYFFPYEQDADGPMNVLLQARKEDAAASTMTIEYTDTVIQRVGNL